MYTAQLPEKGPFVIRYPRGRGVLVDWKCPLEEIPVGKGRRLIEDGARKGGMGSAVLEFMADNSYTPHIERIGVPDTFIEHGTVQELYQLCGMDEEGIYNILIKNDE